MGFTLGAIGLLTGSLEIDFLGRENGAPNIPENRGIVMDNSAFYKGKANQKMKLGFWSYFTYRLVFLALIPLRNNGLTLNR
ncbi:hypothetical protein [Holospora curviuscula]|uniref:Uncharacterized protein n=1 Tax=Holospora curviuscula TaxID=1082868 RepID=A0A2S5RAL4_9PROT|nr:hypothetical protein [Holospora curviuscula]PPE04232.1 hypothetical protein HCUR_00423 [Holospora curviuscula]